MIAGKIEEKQMKIGRFEVGRYSKNIVTSLYRSNSDKLIDLFKRSTLPVDRIYEIRYDLFDTRSPDDLRGLIRDLNDLSLSYIFTYRGSEKECFSYNSIASVNGATAIDIDISLLEKSTDISAPVIASAHLFNRRPSPGDARRMLDSGHEMVKLAVKYTTFGDFLADLSMLCGMREKYAKAFAFIPMGEESRAMRVVSLLMLSDTAYAKHDLQTAEGQLTYDEYSSILNMTS